VRARQKITGTMKKRGAQVIVDALDVPWRFPETAFSEHIRRRRMCHEVDSVAKLGRERINRQNGRLPRVSYAR